MTETLVALEEVCRFYDGDRVTALRSVTLTVGRGEFVAIVGPSGSGKSTLLHVMCGLDRPTAGRVCFAGRESPSRAEWTRIRARHVGFVFQAFYLLPTLTARENVEIPMFGVVAGAGERTRRAEDLLARVGLANRARHRPSELSGGERQRVAIARSLANSPLMIAADEPTGNLDASTSAEIMQLFRDIHGRERSTLVVVTHNPDVAAYADRCVELLDGRIVSTATPSAHR
jgi:ABC-type lipoprotein export system ATPase subunit